MERPFAQSGVRFFLTFGLLSTLALRAGAAERFTQTTDVVAVEVPVQVLKDGTPVRNLKASDFEVFQGRTAQVITGFEVLDLKSLPADKTKETKAVPPSGRRRFLLLFDLSFSNQVKVSKAREAALRLLSNSFHSTDLIGVASYRPTQGPRLVVGFTPDRLAVRQAIDSIGFVEQRGVGFDPLEIASFAAFGEEGGPKGTGGGKAMERAEAAGADFSGLSGGGGDPFGAALTATAHLLERESRDNLQRDLNAFLQSVEAFARALSSIGGRKNVVLLSEGFNSALVLGTTRLDEVEDQNLSSLSGQLWRVDSDKRFGDTKSSNNLEKMLEALRRADCVVQAIDIGGVRAGEKGSGEDGLFVMANSTGGELYRNFNDLTEAVGRMLERTSVTYVLTIQPDVARDGAYHKIRVELRDKSLGKPVYRPGYYAPVPFGKQKPMERMLQTASTVVTGREGGKVEVAALAAPFELPGGKAYVPVVIEIGGASLLADSKEGAVPAEVYVYGIDAQGSVRDFFTQTIGLDLAKLGETVRAGGIKFFGDLELPPGSYSIRILVRNGQTGASGLKDLALEVPAFGEGKAILLPAFFPAPTDRWLIAREAKAGERGVPKGEGAQAAKIPYPFMSQGQPYVPASLPALRAEAATRISLVGYHLGEGTFSTQATILDGDGHPAGEGTVRITSREADGGVDRLAATFQPPKLAPGDYTLLLTLTDSKGGTETSATSFVIPAAAGAGG